MDLPLKTQLEVYQGHDQIILVGHKVIKQVCWLKTLVGLCPTTKYNAHHCKCKWDNDVVDKQSKTSQKRKRPELNLDIIVEEIAQKHTHHTIRQNPPPTSNKQRKLRKQIQYSDDVVVNFISPTSIVSDLEGVDMPNVVTSNNIEKMATIDIMAQQETTTNENGIGIRFRSP